MSLITDLKFDLAGLIPAIVQDAETGAVLMVAYMNGESLAKTLETGECWFWSRSRECLWHKGEDSGAIQKVREIRVDCDLDALLVQVVPQGPACHTGERSCFFRRLDVVPEGILLSPTVETRQEDPGRRLEEVLSALKKVIVERRQHRPEGSYTGYLFEKGLDKILKKIGEESAEVIIASKNEQHAALVAEMSDLIYHLLVLAEEKGVGADELAKELESRRKG